MIPKIFHQIWLGGKPLPEQFQKFQKTWTNAHPNWELKIWNESNIETIPGVDMQDVCLCKNFSEQSDYLRYIIILNYGGVYIDTDFECLKSIENIIRGADFFIAYDTSHVIPTGIFGSIAGHYILQELCNTFHERLIETKNWNKYGSNERIGPGFVETFLKEKKYIDKIRIFPGHYFYPIHWKYFSGGKNQNKNIDVSNSFGIHHYDSHWISPWLKFKIFVYNLPFFGSFFHKIIKYLRKNEIK